MTAYRAPDFNERIALSRETRRKALDKLRAKPLPNETELAGRKEVRLKREQAEAAQRALRAAERQAAADLRVAASEATARAAEAANIPPKSDAEKKAERDARYAARKARK